MGIRRRNFVLAVSALAVAAIAAKPILDPVPFVIWNASQSVPIGLYFVSKRQPNLGEIALIRPTEWVEIYASARGYLPLQTPLLKPVRAIKGSFVCRFGRYVFIDGNHGREGKISRHKSSDVACVERLPDTQIR